MPDQAGVFFENIDIINHVNQSFFIIDIQDFDIINFEGKYLFPFFIPVKEFNLLS